LIYSIYSIAAVAAVASKRVRYHSLMDINERPQRMLIAFEHGVEAILLLDVDPSD